MTSQRTSRPTPNILLITSDQHRGDAYGFEGKRLHTPHLDLMATTGADVVSLGARHDLGAARQAYPNLVFQGNVNEEVLRTGTPETVRAAVRAAVAAGGGTRHIVNLNHGVDKGTPVENFQAYVSAATG